MVSNLILPLLHPDTALRTLAERSVATLLQGSCQVPLAVFAQISDSQLHITGLVGTPDGQTVLRSEISGEADQVKSLSAKLAQDLLHQGADQIIASLAVID
jgi:hydroxymethylbilane synthase